MNRNDKSVPLAPPKRRSLLLESRTAIDLLRMTAPLLGAQLRRVAARDGRVDDRRDPVSTGAAHQPVRRLAVGGGEGPVAEHDGVPV